MLLTTFEGYGKMPSAICLHASASEELEQEDRVLLAPSTLGVHMVLTRRVND